MNSIAGRIRAMGLVALVTIYPQETLADGFVGAEFLSWSNAAQDSYIQTSVTMAAIIATETHKPVGDCLANWYLAPEASGPNDRFALQLGHPTFLNECRQSE